MGRPKKVPVSSDPEMAKGKSAKTTSILSRLAGKAPKPALKPAASGLFGPVAKPIKVRKPHRFRSGTVAVREIKKHQKGTDLLIRKLPFNRLVREIMQGITEKDFRVSGKAILALQEAAEAFQISLFDKSASTMLHRGGRTVVPNDMRLVLGLAHPHEGFKTSDRPRFIPAQQSQQKPAATATPTD